jgi:hypothetical protein
MLSRSRSFISSEHFQHGGRCTVEEAQRQQGLSAVHMHNLLLTTSPRGWIDIWDYGAEILFSRAHVETDPVSTLSEISELVSIPAGMSARHVTGQQFPLVLLQRASTV